MIKSQTLSQLSAHDVFCSFLKQNGYRQTQERMFIMETAMEQKAPFTAADMHRLMAEANFSLSPVTVYNTLELLCRAGLLLRSNGTTAGRYSPVETSEFWVECRYCGKTLPLRNRQLLDNCRALSLRGFAAGSFHLSVTGICTACSRKLKHTSDKRKSRKK